MSSGDYDARRRSSGKIRTSSSDIPRVRPSSPSSPTLPPPAPPSAPAAPIKLRAAEDLALDVSVRCANLGQEGLSKIAHQAFTEKNLRGMVIAARQIASSLQVAQQVTAHRGATGLALEIAQLRARCSELIVVATREEHERQRRIDEEWLAKNPGENLPF